MVSIGVKATPQIFVFLGDQKNTQTQQNLVSTRGEPVVTNSKLDWAVVFTARYARRNRKTIHLGTRLRKPSKAAADPLNNHEGRYTREQKQVNPHAGSWCGIVQTGEEGQEPALAYTRKPRET